VSQGLEQFGNGFLGCGAKIDEYLYAVSTSTTGGENGMNSASCRALAIPGSEECCQL